MWSLAATALSWILSLCGFGKPDPFKQGEESGIAKATAATELGTLHDIKAASDARDSVRDNPDDILRDPANAGPVGKYSDQSRSLH